MDILSKGDINLLAFLFHSRVCGKGAKRQEGLTEVGMRRGGGGWESCSEEVGEVGVLHELAGGEGGV
jgi:hypothetical protein